MLVKIFVLFLVAMGVLAVFGRLRFPGALGKQLKNRRKTCVACGRHVIGLGKCPCDKKA